MVLYLMCNDGCKLFRHVGWVGWAGLCTHVTHFSYFTCYQSTKGSCSPRLVSLNASGSRRFIHVCYRHGTNQTTSPIHLSEKMHPCDSASQTFEQKLDCWLPDCRSWDILA